MAEHNLNKPHGNLIDITGQRFGRLVVIKHVRCHVKDGRSYWECRCDCGSIANVIGCNLKRGLQVSCGCHARDVHTTHGTSSMPERRSWASAQDRCFNSTHPAYHRYGGRGITMCEEWRNSFERFLTDMGPRPEGTTLDRINNDGNYEPGNCRWATAKQQARNFGTYLTHDGVTMRLSEWSELKHIPYQTLRSRLRSKNPDIFRPVSKKKL